MIKRCKPEKNDLLFCRIGTLGRCALIRDDREFSIFVSLGLIKFFTNFIDKDYFEQLMNSPIMYKQYLEIKAGGLHTNKLNLTDMPKLIIPIPPLNEQKRIVEKIDQLMKLCDELKIKVKEKMSDDKKTLNEIKEIGKKMENSISEYFDREELADPTINFD